MNGSIDEVMRKCHEAFKLYRNVNASIRSRFLSLIALRLSEAKDELIKIAASETNLAEARLRTELTRTSFQLKNYGEAAASERFSGHRESISKEGTVLKKLNLPIGPVIVFGASNFPFAYSTAGGDTASALAAGCTVVVKGHPAHIKTSRAVSEIITKCLEDLNLPENVFQHVEGFEAGELLVKHQFTKAVAFTGSLSGGRQLFDWGSQRPAPIPVFAEMGSLNPVYILPGFNGDPERMASMLATSITGSSGQFCTKPGFIISLENDFLSAFLKMLKPNIENISPSMMLHEGIFISYKENLSQTLQQNNISVIATSNEDAKENEGHPIIASCTAQDFLLNPLLHQEVFGPFSLVIKCRNINEMKMVAESMEGQLTSAIWAAPEELKEHSGLLEEIREKCGRMIFNGVPTGVEVCDAMHHGGPYPATTDSRFTSVGSDAILRFLRPVTYQGWPEEFINSAFSG